MTKLRKGFLIFFSSFFALLLLSGVFLYGTVSGHNIRKMIAGSFLSSQHPDFAKYFLSSSELQQLENAFYHPPVKHSNLAEVVPSKPKKTNPLSVSVDTIEDANFTAKVMKVSDPTTIHLVSTKYRDKGQPLSDLIKQNGGIGGINAGGFKDPGGVGTGGEIIGIAISDGNVKSEPGASYDTPEVVCGFNKSGQFVTGSYSIRQLLKMNVTQAVSFGPQLLVNGQNIVTDNVESAFGWAPRTAIGQAADGTVLMIVTDGRFYWDKRHRGASMRDLVKIFQTYGAVDAFALDGGGSATMIYKGELQLKPATNTDVGMRYLPNGFIVIPHD